MRCRIHHSVASLMLAIVILSCSPKKDAGMSEPTSALQTDFIQLKTSDADVSIGYPGSIEGQDNVEIRAQATGYLEAVYVKEGQFVNKGQTLFKINPSVYNQQINSSGAAVKVAQANLANAKLEVEKLKPLVEGNVVSDIQLKTAQANYNAMEAQLSQAKAALGSTKITADFTFIKAPVSGYIGRIPNRIGNLISQTDSAPLTSLSNIQTVNVYFSMNEADFITYTKDTANEKVNNVQLILADGSTYSYKGNLESASGNFDKNTGSIPMKAVFINPEKLLRAGGTAKVMLHQLVSNVVKIPKSAVKDIQDKFFVYKLSDKNKVQMVPIGISKQTPNHYFVSSGVKTGDKIAVNKIDVLTEGAEVAPKTVNQK